MSLEKVCTDLIKFKQTGGYLEVVANHLGNIEVQLLRTLKETEKLGYISLTRSDEGDDSIWEVDSVDLNALYRGCGLGAVLYTAALYYISARFGGWMACDREYVSADAYRIYEYWMKSEEIEARQASANIVIDPKILFNHPINSKYEDDINKDENWVVGYANIRLSHMSFYIRELNCSLNVPTKVIHEFWKQDDAGDIFTSSPLTKIYYVRPHYRFEQIINSMMYTNLYAEVLTKFQLKLHEIYCFSLELDKVRYTGKGDDFLKEDEMMRKYLLEGSLFVRGYIWLKNYNWLARCSHRGIMGWKMYVRPLPPLEFRLEG